MCFFKLVVSYCVIVLDSPNKPRNSTQLIGHLVEKITKPRQTHKHTEVVSQIFFFANLPRWKCISWSCSAASSWPCQMLADIIDITGSKLLRQSQNGRNPCNSDGFPLVFPEIFLNFDFSDLFFALYLRLFSVQLQRGQCGTAA